MFKKIITILLTFSIIFWTSFASEKFSIKKVDVLSEDSVNIEFSSEIKKKDSLEDSFKVTDKDKQEIIVKSAKISWKNILLTFYDKLKKNEKYNILVLDLQDVNGNTIESGYDANISFIVPEKFEKKENNNTKGNDNIKEKNTKENNNSKEKNNINNIELSKKIESKSSSEILSDEELENIRKKVENNSNTQEKNEDKNIKTEENNIKTWTVDKTEIENTDSKKSEKNVVIIEDLPTAWTAENILIIFSLFLTLGFFIRKKIF